MWNSLFYFRIFPMCLFIYMFYEIMEFFFLFFSLLFSKCLWESFLGKHIYGWLFRQKQQSIKHEHTILASVNFIAFLSQMIASKSSKTFLLNLSVLRIQTCQIQLLGKIWTFIYLPVSYWLSSFWLLKVLNIFKKKSLIIKIVWTWKM